MASMPLKEQIMEVISGPHVAAVATLDGKLPAVRFMVLARPTRHDPCRGNDEILEKGRTAEEKP